MLAVGLTVREEISQDILHQCGLKGTSCRGAEMRFLYSKILWTKRSPSPERPDETLNVSNTVRG